MARGRRAQLRPEKSAMLEVPRAPSWLSRYAKAEWNRVAPLLVERRVLTDADLGSLENYCLATATVRQAEQILQTEGLTIMGLHGPKSHPACRLQSDAMTRARQLAGELGLTPVSRNRPAVREDADADDDLLNHG